MSHFPETESNVMVYAPAISEENLREGLGRLVTSIDEVLNVPVSVAP